MEDEVTNEEMVEEVVTEEVAQPTPKVKEPEKKEVPKMLGVNEEYFRKGMEIDVEGIPCKMMVHEVRGVYLTLKRMDLK